MESLRESINQLIQNTLAMEGPRVTALHNEGIYSHSQPMYEDSQTEEILEINQQAPKKAKISLKIKLLIGIRSDILLQESSILPQELNLEIFYQTFLTQGLAKVIFIMKISS